MFNCDFSIPKFQKKIEGKPHKTKLYAELSDKAEVCKNTRQNYNHIFKMCCAISNCLGWRCRLWELWFCLDHTESGLVF